MMKPSTTKPKQSSKKKYIPNHNEANIILAYFIHNNFQDFNTWQQISHSKCQFEYVQKSQKHQCKAILKFDNEKNLMPIIIQSAVSKTKKNSKRKALRKIIQQLIYLGLIGYGFKESDFIKKIPKRRKQSSEDDLSSEVLNIEKQQQNSMYDIQPVVEQLRQGIQIDEILNSVNIQNFEKLWHYAIRSMNFKLCISILRRLQNKEDEVVEDEIQLYQKIFESEINEEQWQGYSDKKFMDPSLEDLTDFLHSYQLQLNMQSKEGKETMEIQEIQEMKETTMQMKGNNNNNSSQKAQNHTKTSNYQLPCEAYHYNQYNQHHHQQKIGNNSFQFFYPIENTFNYLRNTDIGYNNPMKKVKPITTSDYFEEFEKKIVMPKFETQDKYEPISYKILQKLYEGLLAHSYNYRLVRCLLIIMEKQVKECYLTATKSQLNKNKNNRIEPVAYYLSLKSALVQQFAYLLSNQLKCQSLLTLQGFLSISQQTTSSSTKSYTFIPKQPQQSLQKKLPTNKKPSLSTTQLQPQFNNMEYVLLTSKVNEKQQYFIACLDDVSYSNPIKIQKLIDHQNIIQNNEKYPYTMYKLVNSKLYYKLGKSLLHVVRDFMGLLEQNTYIILQPPTYPILRVIAELLAQLLSKCINVNTDQSNNNSYPETFLIVTEFPQFISNNLNLLGFKAIYIPSKINNNNSNNNNSNNSNKFDDKTFSKKSSAYLICVVSPQAIFSDIIKNYQFTRVIVQGAHAINQIMVMIAINKGAQKLYLIGDQRNLQISSINTTPTNNNNIKHHKYYKYSNSDMLRRLLPIINKRNITTLQSNLQPYIFSPNILSTIQQFYYNKNQLHKNYCIQSPIIKGFPWPSFQHHICFINIKQQQQFILNIQAQICIEIIKSIIGSGFIKSNDIGCRVTNFNMYDVVGNKIRDSNIIDSNDNGNGNNGNANNGNNIVEMLTGSKFRQRDLCILLLGKSNKNIDNAQIFNAALQQCQRGLIVIGDLTKLYNNTKWFQILKWANTNKLILNYHQ